MASKQVVSNIINEQRAKATEATFGKSGDPWREGPALAGLHQALKPDYAGKAYSGDKTAAYTDRYGTRGLGDMTYNQPEKAEASQKANAEQKGATAKGYRVPIGEVVQ